MRIAQFLKHYKISPQELKSILKANGIKDDIRFVKSVPEEWIQLLTEQTGIEPFNPVTVGGNKQSVNANQKLKEDNLSDLSDLKVLNTEKTKNSFVAYVKFVSDDGSHAFLKRIDDINELLHIDPQRRDENDFKLFKLPKTIYKDQLVICTTKANRLRTAKFKSTTFKGTVNRDNHSFTDWVSFSNPMHVSNGVKLISTFDENEVAVVELSFKHRAVRCTKMLVEPDKKDVIQSIKGNFLKVLNGEQPVDENLNVISLYKTHDDSGSFKTLVSAQFEKEVSNVANYTDKETLRVFLRKWNALDPDLITLSNFKSEIDPDIFFESWLSGDLPVNFFGNELIDFCLKNEVNDINEGLPDLTYIEKLNLDYTAVITEQLQKHIDILDVVDSKKTYQLLSTLILKSELPDKEVAIKKVNQCLSPELKFEYWLEHKEVEFPRQLALERFEEQDSKGQERILHVLSDDELYELLPKIREQSDSQVLERLIGVAAGATHQILNPVSFDIESDTNNIFEIAWNENETWEYHKEKEKIEAAIDRFKIIAANDNNILLGHNILSFDCPILEEYEVAFQKDQLWDTLLIEMLLSPDLKNFALKTNHNAVDDAKLTLELFTNQVLHILKMPDDDFNSIINCLPGGIVKRIAELRSEVNYEWIYPQYILARRNQFYRPQPQANPLVDELALLLQESIAKTKIVVGPNLYLEDLVAIPELLILHNEKSNYDFEIIRKGLVLQIPEEQNWQKQVLLQYLSYCSKKNILPYWGNLPAAVKIKLAGELDINSLLSPPDKPDWQVNNTLFLSINVLQEHKEEISKCEKLDFFILDPDLLSITQKELIQEIDQQQIISGSNSNHFWMKFSGGQSFVGLTENQAASYSNSPERSCDNYWIEKYQFGKYRLYGNRNWEELVESIPHDKKNEIQIDKEQFNRRKVYYAVVNSSSAKGSAVIRFNPESIYRSRYWVFQKMLVEQIDSSKSPSVLLVQRNEEIKDLQKYFQSLGYFIPASSMPLGRQLELLHLNKSYKRLLIISQHKIGKLLHVNYLGSLNIILDSFSLAENLFKAKNTSYYNSMASITLDYGDRNESELEEEELMDDRPKLPMEKDAFFQLKLQAPYITYLRNMINNYDPEHQLWLLDPRISDFPQLGESWRATRRYMNVWDNPESYEADAKEADKHIQSARPINRLPFSQDEIKQILASTFLGNGDQWYDYQEEYLDKILPGESDFLISLPTGGGKSLLFQSPALFKSSFSNRLTIVVTPLKALMEDQVKGLWNKGFMGSVEYINSDRSSDTPLIYRSLAGGELAMLYITPERFRSRGFLNALSMRLKSDGGLEYAVFDEAHCVSQWGHEFRPDYLNSARAINNLKKSCDQKFPILLFSATVSEKVFQDFNMVFT